MSDGFKYNKKMHNNMHDIVASIKEFKTKDEGRAFMAAFRKHMQERVGPIADTSLSRFIQRNYSDDSEKLHELLELTFWKEPTHEAPIKKTGRKKRDTQEKLPENK